MDSDLELRENKPLVDPWRKEPGVIAKELKDKHRLVNYPQTVGDNRVLFLGETHFNRSIREHIVRHAGDLNEAGITYYAIEAKEAGNEAFERLNKGERVDLSKVDVGPGRREDCEEAIRALAAQGIKVVAIDIDQSKNPSKEERETRLAENLSRVLENDPNAKVVVLIGGVHTFKKYKSEGVESLAARIINKGIPSVVVQLTGGQETTPRNLTEAAKMAGLGNQEFVLDLRPYANSESVVYGGGETDFVIHLPQVPGQ